MDLLDISTVNTPGLCPHDVSYLGEKKEKKEDIIHLTVIKLTESKPADFCAVFLVQTEKKSV